jgi:hypothetical protein
MKNTIPGGVPDDWTGHPSADRTTVAELKSVPPVIGTRPLQGKTAAKRPPRKDEEPSDAA